MTPFASVVVPTKNRPELLARALASVLAQELADWEAVVADDGDGSGIAAAEAFGDRRIRALPSRGSGLVDTRSTAIEAARGEIVCWLDDDDWWDDPRHLTLLREARADGSFWFRGGWIVHPDGRREPFDHDADCASLRRNNTVLTSSIAYPRALHDRLGPLDPETGSYCDWDFLLRLCDAGLAPTRLPGRGVCYAVHGGNASAEVASPARLAGFRRFTAKHGLDIVIANHVTMHRMLTDGDWEEREGGLEREFTFESFGEAIAFVNRIAELAEREDHHPDLAISYRRVTVRWTTHSAGGVTDRDRALAAATADLA
jgi:pterin-4a-carbinolamine dehydratase